MTTQGTATANKQNPARPPVTHNAGTSGLPLPQFSAQAAVSVLRLPLQNGIGIPAGNNSLERLGIPEGLHGIQTTSPQASMTLHGQTKLKTGHGKKTKGRVKIKMEFIENKLRRYTTFSKRKAGLMKKAFELSTLTGTEVMLLVASETGHVYTFATRKLQPMITSEAGKALIQTCLNSPDLPTGSDPSDQSPLEHRMNLDGTFEDPEMGLAGSDDFDDGDYMDDDGDSSNESPSGPSAASVRRARVTSQNSTGVQHLTDDNGSDLRLYQEENYANLGGLEDFQGYSAVFNTGKHEGSHQENNGSYDAGEDPVYYDAVTPTGSTQEGI